MRIYDGSPRQDWEEVLRSIGAFADRERLKELLLLELEGGFLLQGLALPAQGASAEGYGALAKRTFELTDDQVAELMEQAAARRGTAPDGQPHADLNNFYELALRVIGSYIDQQRVHDVFFLEQEGSFVLRLYGVAGSHGGGHQLAEFTREEILAMIQAAPEQRNRAEPAWPAQQAAGGQQQREALQ